MSFTSIVSALCGSSNTGLSLARVAMEYAAKPYDDAAAFEFGLDLILDGLQSLLE